MIELAPCPFCMTKDAELIESPFRFRHQIKCNNCGAMGPFGNGADDTATEWNNRAASPEVVERICRAVCEEAGYCPDTPWPRTPTAGEFVQFVAGKADLPLGRPQWTLFIDAVTKAMRGQ